MGVRRSLTVLLVSLAASGLIASSAALARVSAAIRLTPRAAVGHPGRRIAVTLTNASAGSITFSPCMQLARRAGRTWRPVSGHRGCSARVRSERAHSHLTLTVHLARGLIPARYRLSLHYRTGDREGVVSTSLAVTAVCAFPKGASVLARSVGDSVAEVSVPGTLAQGDTVPELLGCARAVGTVQVLTRLPDQGMFDGVEDPAYTFRIAFAGAQTAIGVVQEEIHYGGTEFSLGVYDLRTGVAHPGTGSMGYCGGAGDMFCGPQIETVVVNAAGDAGTLFTDVDTCPGETTSICEYEQIDASDRAGLRSVDKVVSPSGSAPALSELRLTGDVLSWSHSDTPMSVVLH